MGRTKSTLSEQSKAMAKKAVRDMVITDIDYLLKCNVVDLEKFVICEQRKKGLSYSSIAITLHTSRENIFKQSRTCA